MTTLFVVFVLCPIQDYFTHMKMGIPREKSLSTPTNRTWAVPHDRSRTQTRIIVMGTRTTLFKITYYIFYRLAKSKIVETFLQSQEVHQ